MTSQINPNNINADYPVPGVPNNTQGFRDNFSGTKNNFQYAADEITELQTKSVFKAGLGNSTPDNNMNDNLIYAVKLNDVSYTYFQNTTTSGTVTLDYSASQYQYISTTGSVSLAFSNWPASGSIGQLNLTINITNVAHTLTMPASVSQGLYGVEGLSPGTPGVSNTITFSRTGQYSLRFTTSDGGTTITFFDFTRPWNTFDNTLTLLAPTVAANSAGALNIVGSTSGNYQPVTNAGGMIHITGNANTASRITNDAFGTGAAPVYVGRMARGTVDSPTPPQANDVLSRFTGVGWNGAGGYGGTVGTTAPCGMDFVAAETFSTTAMGSEIRFYNAPLTSNVRTLSATISTTGITIPGTSGVTLTDSGTVGYGAGAGGTATQSGGKNGAVTLSKPSGQITLASGSLGAGANVVFTLTNTTVSNTDVMIINHISGGTIGAYEFFPVCNSGTANITVVNRTAGSLNEQPVIRFAVIKGSIT